MTATSQTAALGVNVIWRIARCLEAAIWTRTEGVYIFSRYRNNRRRDMRWIRKICKNFSWWTGWVNRSRTRIKRTKLRRRWQLGVVWRLFWVVYRRFGVWGLGWLYWELYIRGKHTKRIRTSWLIIREELIWRKYLLRMARELREKIAL